MQGLALDYARTARPFTVLLRAFLACGLLYPFFRLASALVYAKVRTNIGIKKGIVSGGGSLTASLDDFFEAIGLPVVNGWGLTEVSCTQHPAECSYSCFGWADERQWPQFERSP